MRIPARFPVFVELPHYFGGGCSDLIVKSNTRFATYKIEDAATWLDFMFRMDVSVHEYSS